MARTRGSGFKMKSAAHGGPMRRNFPSAFKTDDPTVKLEEVTVSGGDATERGADKFARVKKETTASTNKAGTLSANYGGTWKVGTDKDGNTLWLNEEGQNVKEAGISQNKERLAKIEEYKKKNTTSNK